MQEIRYVILFVDLLVQELFSLCERSKEVFFFFFCKKDIKKFLSLLYGMAQGREQIPERWTYDVFLSFRGADVRKNFLSHLYDSLRRCGISTFMDDVELERGKYISPELLKAIETSKILIVVLTKNYASSAWCLDELVHIMKCHKNNPRHLVFPIFFYADPSDIRWQQKQ
ncbi:Toll/interleukin-1 receptor homology (TIR) domain [Arabidopsis suecica]|uniref:Toll/interleukin-1 receptor homology (TIR) domain n=1 Tax=Arabidopsis suecica TaxID=45249 RepID=A0A8T1YQF8_ARASU|nr:Toll/interleukin-1 receptor homology (TIR) domain [Arabidopsis suecica]